MQSLPLRVLVAGLYHETNTFLPGTTSLAEFIETPPSRLLELRDEPSPMGGVLTAAHELGWQVVPGIDLRAMPSALVERDVVEHFERSIAGSIARTGAMVDGILFVLHGAMVAQGTADVEGRVVRFLRRLPYLERVRVATVVDLHANLSQEFCMECDIVRAYRTNPHVDGWQCGFDTAHRIDGLMRTRKRGIVRHDAPGIVLAPVATGTDQNPMAALEAAAREFERSHPDFLSVDVLAGFAYADVPDTGVSFTVSCTGSVRDTTAVLDRLCAMARELGCRPTATDPDVRSVLASLRTHFPAGSGPVLLEEPSDNIGGGAPGDTTELLAALLEFDLPGSAAVINDPETVQSLNAVEVGASVRVDVGGKSGAIGATQPVLVDAILLSRSDGRFDLEDPTSHLASMGTRSVDMGPCVVLGVRNTRILVTSHKTPPFDLGQWRSQGIAPEELRVVGIKAAVAHRQAWDPICRARIRVETLGPCAADLRTLPYRHIRRPVFPLDD